MFISPQIKWNTIMKWRQPTSIINVVCKLYNVKIINVFCCSAIIWFFFFFSFHISMLFIVSEFLVASVSYCRYRAKSAGHIYNCICISYAVLKFSRWIEVSASGCHQDGFSWARNECSQKDTRNEKKKLSLVDINLVDLQNGLSPVQDITQIHNWPDSYH